MDKSEIKNVLDVLAKYRGCHNIELEDCLATRSDCINCPYYVTDDVLNQAIDQMVIMLKEQKEANPNQLSFANVFDFIQEIHRMDTIIQADLNNIQFYVSLLGENSLNDKNSSVICNFSFHDYCVALDPEDIQMLLANAEQKLDTDIDYLKTVMESDQGK